MISGISRTHTRVVIPEKPAPRAVLLASTAIVISVAIGYATTVIPSLYVFLAIFVVPSLFLFRDRVYLLCAVAGSYILLSTSLPPLLEVGSFSLRIHDLVLAPLLADTLIRLSRFPGGVSPTRHTLRILVPGAIFLTYIGMSLFLVAKQYPAAFATSVASFSRLFITSFLLIIAYITFTTEDRLRQFVGFLAFLSSMGVLFAAYKLVLVGDLARRISAFHGLGVNELGAVSGLLVVLGYIQLKRRIFDSNSVGYLFLFLGLVGIFCGKSMGAVLSTVLTVGAYQVLHMRRDLLSVIRLLLGIAVGISLILVIVSTLRPGEIPSLLTLQGGSLVHRLVMAQAGLEIFKQNPLLGVGWKVSSSPDVVGSTDIGHVLRSQYAGIGETLFPDVKTTSVHNMYIQFLAELGLVGTFIFIWFIFCVRSAIRRSLNELPPSSRLRGYVDYCSFGLIFLLVKWNATPLVPGQVELSLALIFLGALAAIPNIFRRESLSGNIRRLMPV